MLAPGSRNKYSQLGQITWVQSVSPCHLHQHPWSFGKSQILGPIPKSVKLSREIHRNLKFKHPFQVIYMHTNVYESLT